MNSEILYERLLKFAQRSQKLVGKLPKTSYNLEYGDQLIRCSASPGSNYIEAIEASSRKDFTYRLKVCRKEVKESIHWLRLIKSANDNPIKMQRECNALILEAQEFIRIFTSSILTSEKNRGIK
ncbi:MAG: four helix bundle protein [Patescibacteria group bacterium]|nr:four helix bundle protein [Patescibacteria group bacterium]